MNKMNLYRYAKKRSIQEKICVVDSFKLELREKRCSKKDYYHAMSSPFTPNGVNLHYFDVLIK